MNILGFLNTLLIGPLKLIFDFIFSIALRLSNSPGLAIIALSFIVNLLVLPLYQRADAIQDEERASQEKMRPWMEHFKKAFSGDERFMIQQAYYRQNHYSPFSSLRALLPLFLEIPFFMAAYQYLSSLELLNGSSFLFIHNLSEPDALFQLGTFTVNVLPIAMTVINIISSEIYTRGAPLKDKLQLYGMALIFLVLLYSSPAGLTFYWTLNNIFSLVKNLIRSTGTEKSEKSREHHPFILLQHPSDAKLFFSCACLLALLTGVLIPASVIHSSPAEFIDSDLQINPLSYIASAAALAFGLFVIWLGVYYALGSTTFRRILEVLLWLLCGTGIINYMYFGTDLGNMSSLLRYDDTPWFSTNEKLINLGILFIAIVLLLFVLSKSIQFVRLICIAGIVSIIGMSSYYAVGIQEQTEKTLVAFKNGQHDTFSIPLSKNGKNVVVLMLDRAISSFIPCIFYEKPELEDKFDGFTYYPNTVSFGAHTNFGAPPIFGGYEYTPEEMNKRSEERLQAKHNEALLMMPTLFGSNDFKVTVVDPPYAGDYLWVPNISIYEDVPNTTAYVMPDTSEFFNSETKVLQRNRNFFCYALTKVSPLFLQNFLYDYGRYNQADASGFRTVPSDDNQIWATDVHMQVRTGMSTAEGIDSTFMKAYSILDNLSTNTEFSDSDQNTLLLMASDETHIDELLHEPEYVPFPLIDNTEYDEMHQDRFLAGDVPLNITDDWQMSHYHINMSALLQLGDWFDYLRENDVYDNTRIILVADHGSNLGMVDDYLLHFSSNPEKEEDLLYYNPLLMVKDFGASGALRTDNTFMTNADVPTLAMDGLIDQPVNPFTGKAITNTKKLEGDTIVFGSHTYQILENRQFQFREGPWFSVHDDVLNPGNWTYLGEH